MLGFRSVEPSTPASNTKLAIFDKAVLGVVWFLSRAFLGGRSSQLFFGSLLTFGLPSAMDTVQSRGLKNHQYLALRLVPSSSPAARSRDYRQGRRDAGSS